MNRTASVNRQLKGNYVDLNKQMKQLLILFAYKQRAWNLYEDCIQNTSSRIKLISIICQTLILQDHCD